MKKKIIKYSILVAAAAIVLINSIYISDLDEMKAESLSKSFDPAHYAEDFWNNKLPSKLPEAVDAGALVRMLLQDKERAFENHSNALGIGNIRYFLVRGEGIVEDIEENFASVRSGDEETPVDVNIAIEYIFGNAVRDASGVVDINEFSNTMDFNNISAEINRIIRTKVVPPFVENVKKGDSVAFTGAIELNREILNLETFEAIPIELTIKNR